MTESQLRSRDLFVLAFHRYLDARAAATSKRTRKALAAREAAREAVVASLPALAALPVPTRASRQPLVDLLVELGGEPAPHRHSCAMPPALASERLSASRSALAAHLVELQGKVATLPQ